jgi:hypothetical protein
MGRIFPEDFTPYRIRPFAQLSTGYNFQWGEEENALKASQSVKSSNAVAARAAGLTFLVGKRLTLDLMYNHRLFTASRLSDSNERSKVRLGFSWSIF